MNINEKIYFASDLHLGFPNYKEGREREKIFVKWLDQIKEDATKLYLLGDVFDFWFEWKNVVPRGFTRFLGKIAELSDRGIEIHFFIGNHDVWIFDYLAEELNITVHKNPLVIEHCGVSVFMAHGDGLGPGDHGYKMLKKIFHNKTLQWMFARIHPNFAIWIANKWSVSSRNGQNKPKSFGENEWLFQFAKNKNKTTPHDIYIFGHRHIPEVLNIDNNTKYVNLGDWISYNTYGVLENGKFSLNSFKD